MQGSSGNRAGRHLVIGAVVVAAGCSSPRDFEVSDHSVLFSSLRLTTAEPLRPAAEEPAAGPGPTSTPGRTFSIELELSGGSGDGTQGLQTGESLSFDGTTFLGPGDVDGEFDLVAGSLALRRDMPLSVRTRISFLIGLGFTELDLELSQNGTKERDTSSALGIMVGMLAETQTSTRTSLYGRISHILGTTGGDDDDAVVFSQVEIGLRWTVAGGASVFGGFRYWDYMEARSGADIELEMLGPVLGVQIGF